MTGIPDPRPLEDGPLAGVRALIFDTFGTVVDWREGVASALRPVLAQLGTDADPYALADAWRARYQPAMEAVRSGARPFVRLDVLHRENLEDALAGFGLAGRLDGAVLDALTLAWHRLDPWPDAVPGLTRLRRRFLIAPHSNGNVLLLAMMARRAGLPWDMILGAEVARAYKPDPDSYLRLVELLGMQPGEVAMVAAHNGDLEAARGCGLRTVFVPRPREHGTGQTTDLAPSQAWDVIASDFIALADRLRA